METESSRSKTETFVRLRNALGLTGLAVLSMASGPCGTCDPAVHRCFERSDLERQRDLALAHDAGVDETGEAGAAGARPLVDDGGIIAVRVEQARFDREQASSWNPANGCPNATQLLSIGRLNGDTSFYWEKLDSTSGTQCCYMTSEQCYGGRPFLVAGERRVAALDPREAAPHQSNALWREWTDDALTEHASVAAFARLTLQLMACGAPPDLVRDSQLASLDELRHARFCLEQAALFGDAPSDIGRIELHDGLRDFSFTELVRNNLREGCVGETLAALRAREQARLAERPSTRAGLTALAEDETVHAELAFRILRWCLQVQRDLTLQAIGELLAERQRERAGSSGHCRDGRWAVEGRLTPEQGRRIDDEGWQLMLVPLLNRALAEHEHAARI